MATAEILENFPTSPLKPGTVESIAKKSDAHTLWIPKPHKMVEERNEKRVAVFWLEDTEQYRTYIYKKEDKIWEKPAPVGKGWGEAGNIIQHLKEDYDPVDIGDHE